MITIPQIQAATAEVFGCTIREMKKPWRFKQLSEARQVSIVLCRARTGATWHVIGKAHGRNHSTALYLGRQAQYWPIGGYMKAAYRAVSEKLKIFNFSLDKNGEPW